MPRFSRATIYLLEDINDNRYIGSTSEKNLNERLNTHRRDEREHLLGIRKRNCSSMKLNLYECIIIPLLECNNDFSSECDEYCEHKIYEDTCRYKSECEKNKNENESKWKNKDKN